MGIGLRCENNLFGMCDSVRRRYDFAKRGGRTVESNEGMREKGTLTDRHIYTISRSRSVIRQGSKDKQQNKLKGG